jgi:hypothetical protein
MGVYQLRIDSLFDYLGHSRGTGTQRVIHRSGLKGLIPGKGIEPFLHHLADIEAFPVLDSVTVLGSLQGKVLKLT